MSSVRVGCPRASLARPGALRTARADAGRSRRSASIPPRRQRIHARALLPSVARQMRTPRLRWPP
eukprot:4462781-Lingulodinium_polyedra.AAC.1